MSELSVRMLPFDFEGVDFMWNPEHRGFSIFGNSISFGSVGFETWLVRVMREVQPLIRDPAIAEEARLFTKQEAVHAAAHSKHVRALIKRYPGLAETRERCIATFESWRSEMSLQDNLRAIASLEATFTPSFKLIIDNRRVLMGGGDTRVASLLLWHFCEEIEHRSSALAIYRHIYGDRIGPALKFGALRKRISEVMAMMRRQFREHVPQEKSSSLGRRAFDGVPGMHKWAASARLLLSQTPWHQPHKAPLPPWSHKWFAAYERGEDMTRFYGRSGASV